VSQFGLRGQRFESRTELPFDAFRHVDARVLGEISPNLKDILVCLWRDDIRRH